MARRYFIAVPKEVYSAYINYKGQIEQDASKVAGIPIKLTNPQFINALIEKNKGIEGLIPFNNRAIIKLSKLKRGKYGL